MASRKETIANSYSVVEMKALGATSMACLDKPKSATLNIERSSQDVAQGQGWGRYPMSFF
jgi:hypothetical protein